MNVVFLSPHFPPNMAYFCIRLRELGATVLGIADAPYDSLRAELRDALTEYYRVDDMHDFDALVRALGWLIHRHGRIDRLDSLNEYWLETEAHLRTAFDIPGIRLGAISRIKRKSAMKRVFERAGVPVAPGRLCRTAAQARAFVDAVGYPVIAKPDVGVGAARTYRLDSDDDLAGYLEDKPRVDYFLEAFVTGDLISYDGLVDRAGRVVFDASISYGVDVLAAVSGADMHYWIDRTIPDDLAELGRYVLDAFRVRERPFHFEFFRQADGSLVALEVNMRQPGGLTVDMWDYGNDIDFYRAWASVVVQGTVELLPSRANVVLWAGRKDDRVYRLSDAEIVRRYGDRIILHERVPGVFAAAIGAEGWMLKGPELEELRAAARDIQALAAARAG
jgi:hypothetical protein